MGPVILLDKSTFQALSDLESTFLYKHFYINICPLLLFEILGDLSKHTSDKQKSEEIVSRISQKFKILGSQRSGFHLDLLHSSLLDHTFPMDGRIPILHGKSFKNSKGESGFIVDDTPQSETIRRWSKKKFNKDEESLSTQWRSWLKGIDLEMIKKKLKDYDRGNNKITTFESLGQYIAEVFTDKSRQMGFLLLAFDIFAVPRDIRKEATARWRQVRPYSFEQFAPYAFHCLKIIFAFFAGLKHSIIGPRSSNLIDIQYLYYLPFCQVFTSDDNFLLKFSKLFIRDDQFIVRGNLLKEDLSKIISHWESLSDVDRSKWASKYGSYPPENEDSIIFQIWSKLMRPRGSLSGNLTHQMTDEQRDALGKSLYEKFCEAVRLTSKNSDVYKI